MPRQPGVSFKYENFLMVGKKMLQTEVFDVGPDKKAVSPAELQAILELGHTAIDEQIEMMYERRRANNPDVVRPSIYTAQLTRPDQSHWDVITTGHKLTGGVVTSEYALDQKFRPYWHAIEDAGFYPEVAHGLSGMEMWMLLRKDSFKRSQRI